MTGEGTLQNRREKGGRESNWGLVDATQFMSRFGGLQNQFFLIEIILGARHTVFAEWLMQWSPELV